MTPPEARHPTRARPPATTASTGGTLWLVPGHLGTPEDLSLRAVRLLRQAAIVLVEPGSEKALEATLRGVGVRLDAPVLDVTGGESVAARVVAALDQGKDVLIFGNEEGIPCFMDPGLAMLRAVREARPSAHVRTVGGASVLGTALMRLEWRADAFVFLGSIQQATPEQQERIRATMRWSATHPTTCFVFVNGRSAKDLARAMAEIPWQVEAEATLFVQLTQPDERVITTTLGRGRPDVLDDLPDDVPAVMALKGRWERGARIPYGRWAERWWRGAFVFRP